MSVWAEPRTRSLSAWAAAAIFLCVIVLVCHFGYEAAGTFVSPISTPHAVKSFDSSAKPESDSHFEDHFLSLTSYPTLNNAVTFSSPTPLCPILARLRIIPLSHPPKA